MCVCVRGKGNLSLEVESCESKDRYREVVPSGS